MSLISQPPPKPSFIHKYTNFESEHGPIYTNFLLYKIINDLFTVDIVKSEPDTSIFICYYEYRTSKFCYNLFTDNSKILVEFQFISGDKVFFNEIFKRISLSFRGEPVPDFNTNDSKIIIDDTNINNIRQFIDSKYANNREYGWKFLAICSKIVENHEKIIKYFSKEITNTLLDFVNNEFTINNMLLFIAKNILNNKNVEICENMTHALLSFAIATDHNIRNITIIMSLIVKRDVNFICRNRIMFGLYLEKIKDSAQMDEVENSLA